MMEATHILLTISQFSLESSLEAFIISFNTLCQLCLRAIACMAFMSPF